MWYVIYNGQVRIDYWCVKYTFTAGHEGEANRNSWLVWFHYTCLAHSKQTNAPSQHESHPQGTVDTCKVIRACVSSCCYDHRSMMYTCQINNECYCKGTSLITHPGGCISMADDGNEKSCGGSRVVESQANTRESGGNYKGLHTHISPAGRGPQERSTNRGRLQGAWTELNADL